MDRFITDGSVITRRLKNFTDVQSADGSADGCHRWIGRRHLLFEHWWKWMEGRKEARPSCSQMSNLPRARWDAIDSSSDAIRGTDISGGVDGRGECGREAERRNLQQVKEGVVTPLANCKVGGAARFCWIPFRLPALLVCHTYDDIW